MRAHTQIVGELVIFLLLWVPFLRGFGSRPMRSRHWTKLVSFFLARWWLSCDSLYFSSSKLGPSDRINQSIDQKSCGGSRGFLFCLYGARMILSSKRDLLELGDNRWWEWYYLNEMKWMNQFEMMTKLPTVMVTKSTFMAGSLKELIVEREFCTWCSGVLCMYPSTTRVVKRSLVGVMFYPVTKRCIPPCSKCRETQV